MDTSGSPRIAHWITASDAGCGSGSGTCSWWADKNLESGDAKWWIRTWNSAGYGPRSNALDFTVSGSISLPATVTLVSPDSDVSTMTPNTAGCGSGTGTCSWKADKDLAEGGATWWINTWNEAVGSGNLGPWSSGMNFAYHSACGSVTFTYAGAEVTYGTVIGANDRCWLDRNLGAI